MRSHDSAISIVKAGHRPPRAFKTGVSLHCHTFHSREVLDFIPHYARKIPFVAAKFERRMEQYKAETGREMDFTRAWWTPPVTPSVLVDRELRHMEAVLGVPGIVSITDHDEIEACCLLHAAGAGEEIPISTEWTVPFGDGFFHIGVHNLPPDHARAIADELFAFTKNPNPDELDELFSMLNALPGVLVVLNHPLWDIENIGQERHDAALKAFFERYGRWFHALEINGFRSWRENLTVARMAREMGYPVVSGGDRHGCSPNTLVNLTDATTFSEMVEEIRKDKKSHVAVLPGYQENMTLRVLSAAAEIMDFYPEFPEGTRHWTERLYYVDDEGVTRRLSHYWKDNAPWWGRAAAWTFARLGRKQVQSALKMMLPRQTQFES